jgi:PAS domain S-box-containing protein
MQDVQAMTLLADAVTEAGFAFSRVRIEMTEAELVEDEQAVRRAVQLLKEKGMKVVLDDFGAGFSSLARLNEIDFDEIKIDGGFIRKIDIDADSRRIISAIVGLGHSLEIPVVAESVETPEHADFLRRLGCEYGQGWVFGRPAAAEDAHLFIRPGATPVSAESSVTLSPYHRQYQLETLYTASPVGLCFVDTAKRHVAANEAFCKMLGKPSEQVVGRTIRETFSPEVAATIEEIVDRKLIGEQGDPMEFQFPGTQEVYLIYHHRVMDDAGLLLGLSVVSLDITARKRAELALHDSERQYRNSVELSPTVMWIAEPDGSLRYISPMADEPQGRSVEDRINSWYLRMNSDDRVRVREQWLAWLPTGLPFETRFRVEWPEGTWRWVRSRARPQIEHGVVERWFGAFSDITREVELEQKVAALEAFLGSASPSS